MKKSRITQLQDSVDQFAALTGRQIDSKLLAETLKEGEYKSDMTPDTAVADPDLDDSHSPWFLDRRQKGETDAEAAGEQSSDDEQDVDQRVITKEQVVEALNWVQDRGFVRSDTRKVAANANQYTFVHYKHGPIQLRVEKIAEGYRLAGTKVLREFEVPPGGPMQMNTMALGQDDGYEMPMHERVEHDLIDKFEEADYQVRVSVQPYGDTGGIVVLAHPIRGKMSSYDLSEHKEMIESVILRTMRESFPKLRPVSKTGVTGWTDGEDRSNLRLIYMPAQNSTTG